ncbi:hypothetical protein Plim_4262 (plasmid) [Planctopirus limnophila DSM 3776]|uniref:Minor tail T domain-containing protein n=1 Tax=Planctopirus limnophila (strain ATCC 43296 / DSM 3776 / IFAM 1008 / Mu 290) TaxID=521674 RepID=D5SZE9_PLAL2|nr:hypothetical protein [Planctopirus limnophila]ADG70069.1 hypothetical protein Plim_4262 [Planctopirus limnophila DSM 3776]
MFAMRLALAMRRVDVDAMLDEMEPEDLREWQAFASIDPFDEERADLRNGILIANLGAMLAPFCGSHLAELRPVQFMPFSQQSDVISTEISEEQERLNWANLEAAVAMMSDSK